MDAADLKNRFAYHKPDAVAVHAHETIRDGAHELAELISRLVPPGREQSLAVTAVEEAMMWANAGIARLTPDGGRR